MWEEVFHGHRVWDDLLLDIEADESLHGLAIRCHAIEQWIIPNDAPHCLHGLVLQGLRGAVAQAPKVVVPGGCEKGP